MASLVHRFRAARFRQASASAAELDVLLPPPLPLIHLPDEPRLARSGGLDGRPTHLPVRRHVHPEPRNLAPEPTLQENRLVLDAHAHEQNAAYPVRERVRVYEYNQPPRAAASDETLVFDSLFEGGNLLRVDRVIRAGTVAFSHEYELWIHPDLKNSAYRQWFYFEVRNATRGVVATFSLVNLAKSGALFGAGLQPCVYSEIDAATEQRGWVHAGSHVRYDVSTAPDAPPGTNALSFQYEFAHDNDRVFFACLQPYTYTDLVEYLDRLERDPSRSAFVRRTELCQTIAQNACDLLSITAPPSSPDSLAPDDKKLIVLSARVHPGEPNASWMMKGMLDYLTGASSGAAVLRNHFVFKVVPMLNPDGVINGNTRVNLAGWDLNRKWSAPVEKLFPTVFHLKRLLANWQTRDRVAIYCDLHGHSINRNIFTYGCCAKRTNKKQNAAMNAAVNAATAAAAADHQEPRLVRSVAATTLLQSSVKNDPRVFPMIVAKNSEFFSFASCDFKVHKSKLNTARVVVNHELGVINSYTLEASFCGPDFGVRKNTQFSTWDLEDMGRAWCQSLLVYFGLLPQVRALDERKHEAERTQQQQQVAETVGTEPIRITTPDAALLELNGDLLSDCEAAISELFAAVDLDLLEDTAAGQADSCDSDLSGAEDAIPPNNEPDEETTMSRPDLAIKRVNGYASAPEEYSHGGTKAITKKLTRRKSSRRKKSTNRGASATIPSSSSCLTGGSEKKLSRKKSKSHRRLEDRPENTDGGGENNDDGDDDGERDDDGDDEGRSAQHNAKTKKSKKTKRRRHRRRKDKSASFRREAPTLGEADAGEDAKTRVVSGRLAELVLPDVPGSAGATNRGLKPVQPFGDGTDSAPTRVELPVATPPSRVGSASRVGSRRQSKLVRILSSEPLELPPVAATYQQSDLFPLATNSGRNLLADQTHKRHREPPDDDDDQDEAENDDVLDRSSSTSSSDDSDSSEPGSVVSEV